MQNESLRTEPEDDEHAKNYYPVALENALANSSLASHLNEFYWHRKFITVFTTADHWSLFRAR